MQYKSFLVPIKDPVRIEEDLNRFLRGQKILTVRRELITIDSLPFWVFSVEYLESGGKSYEPDDRRSRVDYRKVLKDDEFAVFSQLREIRKEIANKEGVPLYSIMNNEQLAKLVQDRIVTKKELQRVEGLGQVKIEKFGDRFLTVVRASKLTDRTASNEASLFDQSKKQHDVNAITPF